MPAGTWADQETHPTSGDNRVHGEQCESGLPTPLAHTHTHTHTRIHTATKQ